MPKKGFYFDRSNQNLENDCDAESGQKWGHHSKSEQEKKGILSEEVMAYYRQVSTTLEEGFESDEAKSEFLSNVFSSLKEECVVVSSNQTVSRILEYLFTHSLSKHLRPLFCKFCKDLALVVFDAFSSHVFQALIQYLPIMIQCEENDEKDDDDASDDDMGIPQVKESMEQLCTFMESHLRDIMTHVYGSHVLRSLLEVLGGVPVKSDIIRSRMSRNQSYKKVIGCGPKPNKAASKEFSDNYNKWFETLSQKIIRLCNYEDHLNDKNYCPLLQSVLLILHKISPTQYEDTAATILEKTCHLSTSDSNDIRNELPHVVQDEISSYLMELLISLTSISKFEDMYNSMFKGKLLYFSVHPYANYVLQRLLSCVPNKDLMQVILDDMSNYIEDILAVNHCGLITKLAEACQRTGTGEKQFVKVLMSAFHCFEPESKHIKIVPLIASFQTYEVFYKDEDHKCILNSVNIHGSLILQQLLQFSKPMKIVSSLLELSQSELIFMICDKCGSHIIDTFFQSPTVKEKHKDAFLKNLEGVFINIACNRNGSRCLENIWKSSTMQQKVMIAEDLCKHQERLEGDFIGRFILRNFALIKFKTRRKEWKGLQGMNSKKQELLQGILEGNKSKQKTQKSQPLDVNKNESKPTDRENVKISKSKGKKSSDVTEETLSLEEKSFDKSLKRHKKESKESSNKKKIKKEKIDQSEIVQDTTPLKKKKKSKKTRLECA